MIHQSMERLFQLVLDEAHVPPQEQARFFPLLARFLAGERGWVDWADIQKLTVGDSELISYDQASRQLQYKDQDFSDLALLKLNGGLGTGMGLNGPKSLLKVTRNESFLEIILGQLRVAQEHSAKKIPLVLMNSFSTAEATKVALRAICTDDLSVSHMNQGTFPRIAVARDENGSRIEVSPSPLPASFGEDRFNPPGHGEVYSVLKDSGVLASLRAEGKKILFISNGDNLGATPDPVILSYIREKKIPFLLEVTSRTANDVKGGTVAKSKKTGTLKLLELVNIPEAHQREFQDIAQFPVFNTNNLWINLDILNAQLDRGPLTMDLIVNPKIVGTTHVVQLEQAMGSAISSFPGAVAMVVPRERFRPVKSTNELFLLRSNLFTYQDGEFRATSSNALPIIDLGAFFKKIQDFESRIAEIPDLTGLRSLRIQGNISFGKNITLEGDVEIQGSDKLSHLPDGAILKSGTHTFA